MSQVEEIVAKAALENVEYVALKDYAKEQGFTRVNDVVYGSKETGYPFVRFERKDGTSECLWLTKRSADVLSVGDTVNMEVLRTARVCETTNTSGEVRVKLSLGGSNVIELEW